MSSDEINLLESVVNITEERDKRTLVAVLAEVLMDLIYSDAIIFLNVPRDTSVDYLELAASLPSNAYKDRLQLVEHDYGPQRIKVDKITGQCLDKKEIVSENTDNTYRMLFPIIVNGSVSGVLDIFSHREIDELKNTIFSFVRIYSNFIAVINDNEHDSLTGLLNRKSFNSNLARLLSSPDQSTSVFVESERRLDSANEYHWLAIMDIDHFKDINDNYGHAYGDEVLLLFADLMRNSFRDSDLLFRYGGEEFIVVLSPTDEEGAMKVFERFRQRLAAYKFPQIDNVTVSIGIVMIDRKVHTTNLFEYADRALYYAKENGRNQVCNYHKLKDAGLLKVRSVKDDIELF